MLRIQILRAPLLLAVLIPACGDGGTGPDFFGLGQSSAQLSGEVNRSFNGTAVFGTQVFGEDVFVIAMDDMVGEVEIGIVRAATGRPPTGTYALGSPDSDVYGELAIWTAGGQGAFYVSESGSLTIMASSSSSLRGSFSFQARREFVGGPVVNVSGTFDAVCLPTAGFGCD
jgi:hypothetical protein